MDRLDHQQLIKDFKLAMNEGDYERAANVADDIDVRRVKDKKLLELLSQCYENINDFADAKDILMEAYSRTGAGRKIAFRLCILSLRTGEFEDADQFYEDFLEMAPKDTARYVLRYEMARARNRSRGELIDILQEYMDIDMEERWAYELAKLYYENGDNDKCIEICDELSLWFPDGDYIAKVMELRQKIQPLNATQQQLLDDSIKRDEEKAREEAEARRKAEEEAEAERERQAKAAEFMRQAREEAEKARMEAEKAREEAERARAEADMAKAQIEEAQIQSIDDLEPQVDDLYNRLGDQEPISNRTHQGDVELIQQPDSIIGEPSGIVYDEPETPETKTEPEVEMPSFVDSGPVFDSKFTRPNNGILWAQEKREAEKKEPMFVMPEDVEPEEEPEINSVEDVENLLQSLRDKGVLKADTVDRAVNVIEEDQKPSEMYDTMTIPDVYRNEDEIEKPKKEHPKDENIFDVDSDEDSSTPEDFEVEPKEELEVEETYEEPEIEETSDEPVSDEIFDEPLENYDDEEVEPLRTEIEPPLQEIEPSLQEMEETGAQIDFSDDEPIKKVKESDIASKMKHFFKRPKADEPSVTVKPVADEDPFATQELDLAEIEQAAKNEGPSMELKDEDGEVVPIDTTSLPEIQYEEVVEPEEAELQEVETVPEGNEEVATVSEGNEKVEPIEEVTTSNEVEIATSEPAEEPEVEITKTGEIPAVVAALQGELMEEILDEDTQNDTVEAEGMKEIVVPETEEAKEEIPQDVQATTTEDTPVEEAAEETQEEVEEEIREPHIKEESETIFEVIREKSVKLIDDKDDEYDEEEEELEDDYDFEDIVEEVEEIDEKPEGEVDATDAENAPTIIMPEKGELDAAMDTQEIDEVEETHTEEVPVEEIEEIQDTPVEEVEELEEIIEEPEELEDEEEDDLQRDAEEQEGLTEESEEEEPEEIQEEEPEEKSEEEPKHVKGDTDDFEAVLDPNTSLADQIVIDEEEEEKEINLFEEDDNKNLVEVDEPENSSPDEKEHTGKVQLALDEEESTVFKNYLNVEGLEESINQVITDMTINFKSDGTSKNSTVFVLGKEHMGKTTLALEIVKIVNKRRGRAHRKVAKIDAEALNKKEFMNVIEKLRGNDLVVEHAQNLSDDMIEQIMDGIETDTDDMIIMFEAVQDEMEKKFDDIPRMNEVFATQIHVKAYDIKEWVAYANEYAESKGYHIDEMANLAVHRAIDDHFGSTKQMGKGEVEEIIDKAIEKAEKKHKKLFSHKKDGEETLLEEKFFDIK